MDHLRISASYAIPTPPLAHLIPEMTRAATKTQKSGSVAIERTTRSLASKRSSPERREGSITIQTAARTERQMTTDAIHPSPQ